MVSLRIKDIANIHLYIYFDLTCFVAYMLTYFLAYFGWKESLWIKDLGSKKFVLRTIWKKKEKGKKLWVKKNLVPIP